MAGTTLVDSSFWGAVLGAGIGSLVIGAINIWLQRQEHAHARQVQQRQWTQESEWRQEAQRDARALQVHALDAARADQRNEWDRQREDRQQQFEHESLVAVQDAVTRFSDVSRWIHLDKRSRLNFAERNEREEGEEYVSEYPNLTEYGAVFNGLRFSMLTIISRVGDERIRTAAFDLYALALDMVLWSPETWRGNVYGGEDPVSIQERRLPQFIRMVGKLLRNESIDDEVFPAITVAHGDGVVVRAVRAGDAPG